MKNNKVMLITGTRKGIGRHLAEYYVSKGFYVIGCSREDVDYNLNRYKHFCLDITDENKVKEVFRCIRKSYGRLDYLINNAGIASMNHIVLTTMKKATDIMSTNYIGTFLFCREAVKLMKNHSNGRIVNFSTVATNLKLDGEAVYASSKAAVEKFTEILAKEVAEYGITVNVVAPTPIETDLIKSVPKHKIDVLVGGLSIKRLGVFEDITNVVDFYLNEKSNYITGQVIYLGGA